MQIYIPTYPRLNRENVRQLWVLSRGELQSCIRSTPRRIEEGGTTIAPATVVAWDSFQRPSLICLLFSPPSAWSGRCTQNQVNFCV